MTIDSRLAVLGELVEDKEDDCVAAIAAHRNSIPGRVSRIPATSLQKYRSVIKALEF